MAVSPSSPQIVHLSLILGGGLEDSGGGRLGTIEDLIVRLGGNEYPPVTGAVAQVAGRDVFVPADAISSVEAGRVTLREARLDLLPFERRPQEVLLKKDVLDRQLINVEGARLVRSNDIELARLEGWYRVVGVDTGPRGYFRRLLPRPLGRRIVTESFVDWADVEPFTGHVPTVRLRVPHPKLHRLHPAELADLVEAASHTEGEEIIEAVGGDPELEADVFEELDAGHQLEFLEDRSDGQIAALLTRMESDDAADLIEQLPGERREDVIELLPLVQRRRLRTLLGYDPATAGGIMSADFVCVYSQATREEAVQRVQQSRHPADQITWLFVMNQHRRLSGAAHLVDVLRADPGSAMRDVSGPARRVRADADIEEVARLMTDYDLTVVAVVDEQERLIGVITVDDVLELVLPKGWRRQFGLYGED